MIRKFLLPFLGVYLLSVPAVSLSGDDAIISYNDRFHPEIARRGMVSSQSAVASKVGLEILKNGGNAFDAAVAVALAEAVVLPRAGNLGGGGFMLVYRASDKKTHAIDYRETAPGTAHEKMFLNEQGEVDPKKYAFGYTAVGVPGTPAGLEYVLKTYGTMTMSEVAAPAIRLARDGFLVDYDLSLSLKSAQTRLTRFPETARIFYPGGKAPEPGDIFRQPDLARTLQLIARRGAASFYHGETAKKIHNAMVKHGGLIRKADLAAYKVKVRKPVTGSYRGYIIKSMPPPSSGGVHLIQMLNVLAGYDLSKLEHNSGRYIHILAEVMKRAYADRSEYLGDPDFSPVPVAKLTSQSYARSIRSKLRLGRVTPSEKIKPGDLKAFSESEETTHFSIVDRFGNAVSNTYTLNFSYGMGAVAEGTGVLLNNEMNDFAAKRGVPNAYGLLGSDKNFAAPNKRMLSSMTPTIVFKDGKPFLITGSPGGSRIITTVLQVLINMVDFKMNIAEATQAVRVHHQWLPDEIRIEKGLSFDTVNVLKNMGYQVNLNRAMGATQSIHIENGFLYGASDPRKPGALTIGH